MQERTDLESASTENILPSSRETFGLTPHECKGKTRRYAVIVTSLSHHARVRIVPVVDHLLDGNLFGASVDDPLRHNDGQNAVLQAGLDAILVDRSRELEGAVKLATERSLTQ